MATSRKVNLAMFNNSDDDEPVYQQHKPPPLDDTKLQQYASGSVRKSRKDKEREAAEAKRKEEEAKAEQAYAEFLDDFQADADQRSKRGFVRAGEAPSGPAVTPSLAVRGRGQMKAGASSGFDNGSRVESASPPPVGKPKAKGKRAMDHFLEEIKKDQAEREERLKRHSTAKGSSVSALAAFESQRGSRDTGDPFTTNVFVANLPANVTEQALGMFFARCGPVASVKIMWPRHDDPPAMPGAAPTGPRGPRGNLSGFVSFMKRQDAEVAVREVDGYEWNGSVLKVGWSRAVPIGPRAMFDLGPGPGSSKKTRSRSRSMDRPSKRRRSRTRSRSPLRSRYRSPSPSHDRDRDRAARRGHSYSRSRSRTPDRRRASRRSRSPSAAYSRSRSASPRRRRRDDSRDDRDDGRRRQPDMKTARKASPPPLPFEDDGANSIYSTDSAEESEREHGRKGVLGKVALRRFESMLRGITGKRGEIAKCMTFCLDHSDAAPQVASIILRSLQVDSTPVPRKVARLHLVCDILHNSAASVTNAWKFRQEFESGLGAVFDHLSSIYQSFPGRITAETFKKQITSVLDVWEDWIVFPPDTTADYRARLDGAPVEEPKAEVVEDDEVQEEAPDFASRFKASVFKPAAEIAEADAAVGNIDGEVMDDLDGIPLDVDLDGVPLDDVDGAPMDDVDGAPMDDVDGAPMDDVDGAPMDDVDGAPMDDVDGVSMDDVDGVPMDDMDGVPIDDIDGAPMDDVDGAPVDDMDDKPVEEDVDGESMAVSDGD